ncbi:hypothetical protein KJN74_05525 [Candidatus Bathyarchaeota archaeon]|nr:hypothetical protein [Candidatus Bathyarchaeota archaeon]
MYDQLYELWKKEKENKDVIQQLPKEFYLKIAGYVKKLKEENRMLDKKTTKAKLLKNELRNVKVMSSEIFSLRYKKLQKGAFIHGSIRRDALTKEEKTLYGNVMVLGDNYNKFYKDILRGHFSWGKKSEKQNFIILRLVQEIPALIGVDLKKYGPFSPEDVAILPPENAGILINQGMAMEVHLN